jgi:hypothetical protein
MKCLGMGGHDPSRLVCHWQDGDGGRVGYDRLAVGGPLSRAVEGHRSDPPRRRRASGSQNPGIPCQDFGELSRVASVIWSLRDKPTCVPRLTHVRGWLALAFNLYRQALPQKNVVADQQVRFSRVATALGLREDSRERPGLGWVY